MVHFTQLKSSKVYDLKANFLGKLTDLVFVDGAKYAEINHLIYEDEHKYKKKVPWAFVKEFKQEHDGMKNIISIHLNSPVDAITQFFMREKEVIVGDILDKQVIDVDGVKLVRINDIILGKVDGKFSIVAVSVGALSFVRRLGIDRISGFMSSKIKENIIPWKSVERLDPEFHDLHLKIQKSKIADLHPEDIADIMEDLSHTERILIFNTLNSQKAAKTLIKAGENVQDSVLRSFKIEKVKELLENIPNDQAADIISMMPKHKAEEILKSMRKETAVKIRKILDYYPESIGSIMKTEFIAVPEDYTAEQTIDLLRQLKPPSDRSYHLYVVNKENHLMGVLSLRALLTADPKSNVVDFMKKQVVYARDTSTKETAARIMARYDLFLLPVVDKEGILRGIVKADDVLQGYIPKRLKREKFVPLKTKARQNGNSKKV